MLMAVAEKNAAISLLCLSYTARMAINIVLENKHVKSTMEIPFSKKNHKRKNID